MIRPSSWSVNKFPTRVLILLFMDHSYNNNNKWRLHAIFSDPRVWINRGSTMDQHGSTWISRLQPAVLTHCSCVRLMAHASCVRLMRHGSCVRRQASHAPCVRRQASHAPCVRRQASGVRLLSRPMRQASCVMRHAPCVMAHASSVQRHASCVMRHASCVRRQASGVPRPTYHVHSVTAARCRS